ncbi:MAG: ubiquitin-conjugating enzyme E2 variant [Candidatus Heimdallarchaeaceae archaeon]
MTVSDEILSREAQFIYERAYGFEPKDGNLRIWKGFIPVRTYSEEKTAEVEIVIPDHFPNVPPTVYINTPMEHPNVEDGVLSIRMLARWRPNYHIFQVIAEVKRLFQRVRAKMVTPLQTKWADPENEITPLIRQKNQLAQILEQKKKELQELSLKEADRLSTHALAQEKTKLLEDEILNVENQLFAIEQKFEDYEISGLEFAKKYHSLRKRLYLLEMQRSATST